MGIRNHYLRDCHHCQLNTKLEPILVSHASWECTSFAKQVFPRNVPMLWQSRNNIQHGANRSHLLVGERLRLTALCFRMEIQGRVRLLLLFEEVLGSAKQNLYFNIDRIREWIPRHGRIIKSAPLRIKSFLDFFQSFLQFHR